MNWPCNTNSTHWIGCTGRMGSGRTHSSTHIHSPHLNSCITSHLQMRWVKWVNRWTNGLRNHLTSFFSLHAFLFLSDLFVEIQRWENKRISNETKQPKIESSREKREVHCYLCLLKYAAEQYLSCTLSIARFTEMKRIINTITAAADNNIWVSILYAFLDHTVILGSATTQNELRSTLAACVISCYR